MHKSAFEIGTLFFQTYWRKDCLNVLDIGSRNVNGTLRDVKPPLAAYLGVESVAVMQKQVRMREAEVAGLKLVLNRDNSQEDMK